MAESGEEWELSKENIKPIQQGRKQNVLKVALSSHPDDIIAHQRQLFEDELRTYSGNDPLAVWCKYIKWVEQNYPKGGREGHIKKLLEQCLTVLKGDKRYFNDDRFVDILLKYANLSGKPVEVYNYMYSCNIGCKLAKFFINWSWELEQVGNLKKADEILTEGLNRRAEPVEKIKSYHADFQIRLVNVIKTSSEKSNVETENSRSAFSVLKPQKRNLAPVMRTGEAVIGKTSSLTLGKQQPQPKSSQSSGKVPFKIYNAENINPIPLVQPSARGSFNLENYKENEQKPIKWNKFKMRSQSLKTPDKSNLDFKFHCDDEGDQAIQTPRSVPKTSNILRAHHRTPSPRIALFEPEDPLKKPMYPKNKVYGGAVEYSLEEIRAAEWQERKKKSEQEKLLEEQQRQIEKQQKEIEYLAKQIQLLQTVGPQPAAVLKAPDMLSINNVTDNLKSNSQDREFNDILLKNPVKSVKAKSSKIPIQAVKGNPGNTISTPSKENSGVLPQKKKDNCNLTENYENKCTQSNSYFDKMIQELYNKTLSNSEADDESKNLNVVNQTNLGTNDNLPFMFYQDPTTKVVDSTETFSNEIVKEKSLPNSTKKIGVTQDIAVDSHKLPFSFYQDPTISIPDSKRIVKENSMSSKKSLPNSNKKISETQDIAIDSHKQPFSFYQDPTISIPGSKRIVKENSMSSTKMTPNITKDSDKFPFELYQDPTQTISNLSDVNQNSGIRSALKEPLKLPFSFFNDSSESMPEFNETASAMKCRTEEEHPVELPHEFSSEEDSENVPPKDYIQESKKRELAGILQPSTNILFIPVEEQEMDEESDIEDDYIFQNRQEHTDDTLIPPSNTEQFSAAKFLASTPYVPRTSKSSDLEESHHEIQSSERKNVPQNLENSNPAKEQLDDRSKVETNSAEFKEPRLSTEMKSTCYPRLPNILSVIMETSSENYSKSSSSNSSGSLTKSNHLEQYSAQHFSLHKSSSKFEVCELSTVSEVSNHHSNISAGVSVHKDDNQIADENFELYTVDFDPFDKKVIERLLKSVNLDNYENIFHISKSIRVVRPGENIFIGDSMYMIESLIAEGAYAKVYKAIKPYTAPYTACNGYSNTTLALKTCKKGDLWEFYICYEIQRRLTEITTLPDIKNSVMKVLSVLKYTDGIVLVNQYSGLGTLLDVVNFYKKQSSAIPELIVMYFTLQILHIVSKLHKCNIIHGDIKPDNFLLTNVDFDIDDLDKISETSTLKLIDFGRAIDLSLYDKGVCFTAKFNSKDLQCNEMKDGKPWVFQLDWYGVLSCIHTMLFLEYMVVKKKNEVWDIEKRFKRYWFTSLWEPLFINLLNIPNCYEEPDVSKFISMIESKLQQNAGTFINQLIRFSSAYSGKI